MCFPSRQNFKEEFLKKFKSGREINRERKRSSLEAQCSNRISLNLRQFDEVIKRLFLLKSKKQHAPSFFGCTTQLFSCGGCCIVMYSVFLSFVFLVSL